MKEKQTIVQELEAKGWTEADIASYTGKTTKSVQFWRNGTHKPGGENLRKLQELLRKPPKGTEREMIEYDLGGAIKKIEATAKVTLSAVAEVLARASNRTAKAVHDELEELVRKELKKPESEQSTAGA